MISSNDQLIDLVNTHARGVKCDPRFKLIVAFNYYDGPEKGFLLFSSGTCVRFSSLGDSKSRLFRAFELIAIEGDWMQRAQFLLKEKNSESSSQIIVPSLDCETLTLLEQDIFSATAAGCYVSVGSPNFDWLNLSPVDIKELEALRQLDDLCAFNSAHKIIKTLKRGKGHGGQRGKA